jgi:predicted GNAT family acetyltransferase
MDIQVQHNSKGQRFETHLGGRSAYLSYTFQGTLVCFNHTFVPEEFRGKGVAAALVRKGLEEARREHWKIVPSCPFVAAFIERHPEFADLVN